MDGLDETTHLEVWERYNYDNAWYFGGKGAGISKGYVDANDVEIRLPYSKNNLDINNFAIGDIIVKGTLTLDIDTQQDLSNYEIYRFDRSSTARTSQASQHRDAYREEES